MCDLGHYGVNVVLEQLLIMKYGKEKVNNLSSVDLHGTTLTGKTGNDGIEARTLEQNQKMDQVKGTLAHHLGTALSPIQSQNQLLLRQVPRLQRQSHLYRQFNQGRK